MRDRQAELLSRLEVGYQFDLVGCSIGRSAGFALPENVIDVAGAPPKLVRARPGGHQAAGIDEPPPNVDRWQAVGGYKLDNPRLGQG